MWDTEKGFLGYFDRMENVPLKNYDKNIHCMLLHEIEKDIEFIEGKSRSKLTQRIVRILYQNLFYIA